MSSGTGTASTAKPGPPSKPGQGNFSTVAPSSHAILLDKLNRRSTPDSEALASSDDETDSHRQEPPQPVAQPQKPARRASWLNDTTQPLPRPRKGSFASSSMSPTTSHPSTPSAEGNAPWGTHSQSSGVIGRAPGAGSAFSWGTAIWNSERKDPPSRLSEVLPSPTSTMPPGSVGGSFFNENNYGQTSPAPRDAGTNAQIPFAIPLHPTPKTYRSQSYSVGQLEPDAPPASMSSAALVGRGGRAHGHGHGHSGLQHRPSRPSMLSEMSNDSGFLGKVKEVDDDDDESATESMQGSIHQTSDAKTIEMLARENAMLRQQQQQQQQQQHQQQQYQNRMRPRASTGAAYGSGNGYSLRESVPEESDYAIDELDEANDGIDLATKRALGRRMSEFGMSGLRSPYENRKLETVKKAYWHSSLGFGGPEGQQSRRHSFADIPTRQGSISSISETVTGLDTPIAEQQQPVDFPPAYGENPNYAGMGNTAAYFTPSGGLQAPPGTMFTNPFSSPYGQMHTPYGNRAPSPHRNVYGISQPRHNQSLYIVLFKCARADVFYIQEGTGLTVKPGDLVIVEADRGTDLGTVAKDNVDWQTAKESKEHYAEEQYKWLMMYSQNAAAQQDGTGAGLMAAANGLQGSAVGGMGPPNQHHMQEPNAGELKPKLIKRLAQSHEIHALRDKEGNEAKAKRVCMQKVKEHGLNMEILDAEFQMDWKKLTFYYFADSYINFNSLVTDLFKIYKTRIWMSAINPASFASPTLGIQAPSGVGPGAVGVGRVSNNTDRRAVQQQASQDQQTGGYNGAGPVGRGFQPSFTPSFGGDRPSGPGAGYSQPNYPYSHMGGLGSVPRPGNIPYVPGVMPTLDNYSFPGAGEYQIRSRFAPAPEGSGPHEPGVPPMTSQNDWAAAFQGLSLNSR